jgi:hypothetical protein
MFNELASNNIRMKETSPYGKLAKLTIVVHFGFQSYSNAFDHDKVRGPFASHVERHNQLLSKLLDYTPQSKDELTVLMPFNRVLSVDNELKPDLLKAENIENEYRRKHNYPTNDTLYQALLNKTAEQNPELALNNIIFAPDIVSRVRRTIIVENRELPPDIVNAVTPATEIILCGEWLGACVRTAAGLILDQIPSASSIIIPRDSVISFSEDEDPVTFSRIEENKFAIRYTPENIIISKKMPIT